MVFIMVSCKKKNTFDSIHSAVIAGTVADVCKWLEEHPQDLEARHDCQLKHTPLLQAVFSQKPAIVAELLERGADVAARDSAGFTSLYRAVVRRDVAIAELLLECGADPNVQNAHGPVLRAAVIADSTGMALLLIDFGADVNAADETGFPVLGTSIMGRSRGLVRLLVKAGASVEWKTGSGASVPDLLREYGWTKLEIKSLLKQHGTMAGTPRRPTSGPAVRRSPATAASR